MRKRFVAIGMLFAVLVSGCWSDSDDSHPFDPLPPVDESVPTLAEPRDPAAVEEAASRIDPCALLKEARTQVKSPHLAKAKVTDHEYTFACTASTKRTGPTSVSVRVGEDFLASRGASRTNMAGATAYTDITVDPSDCYAELPIEPGQSIAIGAHGPVPRPERCALATELARATARVLRAHPDSSIGVPPLPWSRCELLRRVLPTSQRDAAFSSALDLDTCYARPSTRTSGSYPIGLTAPDLVTGLGHRVSINGRRVYRTRESGSCTYAWKDERVAPKRTTRGISVTHPRCKQAEQMARRTWQTLNQKPPQDPPRQQPLTYPAESVESGTDCAYLPFDTTAECGPSLAGDLPSDPVDLIRHAESDPKVSCAMANNAVRDHFGDQFVPVVAARRSAPGDPGCAFTDRTNSAQVWIDASTEPAESDSETDLAIGGHPAMLTKAPGQVSMAIAYDSLDEPGQLIGTVVDPTGSSALDKRSETLARLMTDLTKKHL